MSEDNSNKNGDNSNEKEEFIQELGTIFTEHWNHARHCENERLWFTNIYAVVVAAILAFIGKSNDAQQAGFTPLLVLVIFGLVLSVLGFLVVITLSLGYAHHQTDIVMIFYYWNKMEFYKNPEKPVYFLDLHRRFYEITIALFTVLFLYYLTQAWTILPPFHEHWSLPLVALAIFAVIDVLYRLKWEKHFSKCWRFQRQLKEDTDRAYRKNWDTWVKESKSWEEVTMES